MESKSCTVCKKSKPFDHYQQIIKRRTYAPGTDDDGIEYFAKETKICIGCRDVHNATNRRYRRRKYPDPPEPADASKNGKIKVEFTL